MSVCQIKAKQIIRSKKVSKCAAGDAPYLLVGAKNRGRGKLAQSYVWFSKSRNVSCPPNVSGPKHLDV